MEYLNEIMFGVFILLIAAHFGLHFYFKAARKKLEKQRAAKKAELENECTDQTEKNTAKE